MKSSEKFGAIWTLGSHTDGVTLRISTCGLALSNPLRIEMHGLLYPESHDPCSYFQAFAISCFESEAECSFPESFLSILLDLQRVMGLVTRPSVHNHNPLGKHKAGALSASRTEKVMEEVSSPCVLTVESQGRCCSTH